jgi:hypothetical protein
LKAKDLGAATPSTRPSGVGVMGANPGLITERTYALRDAGFELISA